MKEYEVEISIKPFKVKVKATQEDDAIKTAMDVFYEEYSENIEVGDVVLRAVGNEDTKQIE